MFTDNRNRDRIERLNKFHGLGHRQSGVPSYIGEQQRLRAKGGRFMCLFCQDEYLGLLNSNKLEVKRGNEWHDSGGIICNECLVTTTYLKHLYYSLPKLPVLKDAISTYKWMDTRFHLYAIARAFDSSAANHTSHNGGNEFCYFCKQVHGNFHIEWPVRADRKFTGGFIRVCRVCFDRVQKDLGSADAFSSRALNPDYENCASCQRLYAVDEAETVKRRSYNTVNRHYCPSCLHRKFTENKIPFYFKAPQAQPFEQRYVHWDCHTCKDNVLLDLSLDSEYIKEKYVAFVEGKNLLIGEEMVVVCAACKDHESDFVAIIHQVLEQPEISLRIYNTDNGYKATVRDRWERNVFEESHPIDTWEKLSEWIDFILSRMRKSDGG